MDHETHVLIPGWDAEGSYERGVDGVDDCLFFRLGVLPADLDEHMGHGLDVCITKSTHARELSLVVNPFNQTWTPEPTPITREFPLFLRARSPDDAFVDSDSFVTRFAAMIAGLPCVEAVALGGSRASGTSTASSDWDFALYYRRHFDPDDLRQLGLDGAVFDVGAWGGGVMNGGAWLTVDGRRVDLHYRDLDDVEYWWREAKAGRYRKELLLFYAAGIPTYTLVAEMAINSVLVGSLPRPAYPDALAVSAGVQWREDALFSARYARSALADRRDVTVAMANGSRALIELAHSLAARDKRWVTNEKGVVKGCGLGELADALAFAGDVRALSQALNRIEARAADSDG